MRRLAILLALLAGAILLGTTWYALVEGFGLLNALYQAVTTITTVGFQEVQPLDTSGRLFTIVYILGGVGLLFYTATAVVETVVVGELAKELGLRRSSRKARNMERHFVICGYGRVVRDLAPELAVRDEAFVIIDRDEHTLATAEHPRSVVVRGDATEEATPRAAGIERARALIAAADSDVENTYMVLTARVLNPGLFIVARAGSEAAERRLESAGAYRVVSPYRIGGRRMALAAVQPMLMACDGHPHGKHHRRPGREGPCGNRRRGRSRATGGTHHPRGLPTGRRAAGPRHRARRSGHRGRPPWEHDARDGRPNHGLRRERGAGAVVSNVLAGHAVGGASGLAA